MVIESRLVPKLPSKYLSYTRRHLRQTSHEQVEARHLELALLYVLMKLQQKHVRLSLNLKTKWRKKMNLLALMYLTKVSVFDNSPPPPDLKNLRISTFHESDFRIFFVFGKSDAKLLMDLLRFPDYEVSFSNRGKMHGEEIFLRGLYELVSGENKFKISRNVFGRCYTYQSRAFSWFVDHI